MDGKGARTLGRTNLGVEKRYAEVLREMEEAQEHEVPSEAPHGFGEEREASTEAQRDAAGATHHRHRRMAVAREELIFFYVFLKHCVLQAVWKVWC